MRTYEKIFHDDLPPERPHDHKIELEPGAQPTVRSQWRLSQQELMELRTQLDCLLEKNLCAHPCHPMPRRFSSPKRRAEASKCVPIITRSTTSPYTPATLPLARYCYRTSVKACSQSPTTRENSKALNRINRFMTRKCSRSSMLSRPAAATYPWPTLLSKQTTSPYSSSEPNRSSIHDRFVGSNISSPTSTTTSPTRRGQIILPMPFPALLPIQPPQANCQAVHLNRRSPAWNPKGDRDPRFTSNFWTKMWELYSTHLHLSMAYHPQTDGLTERTNQIIEQLIRTTCTDPTQWEDSLPLIEFAYNNALHQQLPNHRST
ncbi:hypothetical protein CLOM_g23062 [Closterium sp. NIES-68]|nr:hypothetical protein CLOM_g23062 [Closterium sp. NIES-68]